ncbi:MAG: aminoacetone oxidase family FAD-binding enzyme, partial [Bacteroidota bacterium]
GGRCNLTHACFDPRELATFYPRGQKELLGPFHHFGPGDTLDWFEKQGVETKVEADGRMFPVSDNSQSIMDALMHTATARGIQVMTQTGMETINPPATAEEPWIIGVRNGKQLQAQHVMVATGSNSRVWKMLAELDHRIIPPVPSLFTFNIKSPLLSGLMGRSVPNADIQIVDTKWQAHGPLLITHWGLSGPGILKLSAWAARDLHARQYAFEIDINWLGPNWSTGRWDEHVHSLRQSHAKKTLTGTRPEALPQLLWERILQEAGIPVGRRWSDLRKQEAESLSHILITYRLPVRGKSTFKEEFVTAGGVDLTEIDMRRFASRKWPRLYLAGEVLNIDAVTGGFNFQAAWTGGWLAGSDMGKGVQ